MLPHLPKKLLSTFFIALGPRSIHASDKHLQLVESCTQLVHELVAECLHRYNSHATIEHHHRLLAVRGKEM